MDCLVALRTEGLGHVVVAPHHLRVSVLAAPLHLARLQKQTHQRGPVLRMDARHLCHDDF